MRFTRRKSLALLTGSSLSLLHARAVHASPSPTIYQENGIAIDGSDPVAYFTQKAPVAGNPSISLDWNRATWWFANRENRIAFEVNPTAFAPQYGGYCAYAVSKNYIAATVPEAWTIVDGKLYLNFSLRVRKIWERNIPGRIAAADRNWPDVLG